MNEKNEVVKTEEVWMTKPDGDYKPQANGEHHADPSEKKVAPPTRYKDAEYEQRSRKGEASMKNDEGRNDEVTEGARICHVSHDYHGVLDPMIGNGFIIGHVPEVNGGASILINTAMSVNEALLLIAHWWDIADSIHENWAEGSTGSSEIRTEPYACNRAAELQNLIAAVIRNLCKAPEPTGRTLCDLKDISVVNGSSWLGSH